MIPMKERGKRTPRHMPQQDVTSRITNFDEVPLGYSKEDAIYEAQRCLQCRSPTCMEGCPADVNIPEFIKKIVEEDFAGSHFELLKTNNLPAITGRVCPQEEQCSKTCVWNKTNKAIHIGRLERFVADWARENKIHVERSEIEK